MDFRGQSLLGDIAGLQAEIDALDVRVTSLETRMTTAETNITNLQNDFNSGLFPGRVYQYNSTSHRTPFIIDQLNNDITLPNDTVLYTFVTPVTPQLQNYYVDGSVFHFFMCGVMNGASASLNICMSNDSGATALGGAQLILTAGLGSTHYVLVECWLMIYSVASPTSASAKFIMQGAVSQSFSGSPPLQMDSVEVHGLTIDPSTDINTIGLYKKDATAFTTLTRTQGWVMSLV